MHSQRRNLLLTLLALWSLVIPAAHARWDESFTLRKKVTLDTTESGTPIATAIGPATVLVRLHDGNFQIESATEDCSDLRIIGDDDRTPPAGDGMVKV